MRIGGIEKDRYNLLKNILQCVKNAGIEGVDDIDEMLSQTDDGIL